MITRNSQEHFFKYFTAQAAKEVLSKGTFKWSTPALFNDPFDNQFDFLLHEDDALMAEQSFNHFMTVLNGHEVVTCYHNQQMNSVMEYLRKTIKERGFIPTKEDIALLKQDSLEGAKNAAARAPEINNFTKKLLSDNSIFCLTETYDNLLMWAHYANNHTGLVIKLAPHNDDSFLTIAQKVNYSEDIPRFTAEDFLTKTSAQLGEKVLSQLTLTKSTEWYYEKEWRIVAGLRNKLNTHEFIPFFIEEVEDIYLGCRISECDKAEIISLTRNLYPHVNIYQATKHQTKFSLVFNKL